MECAMVCGSEEFYAAINVFRHSVELFAAVVYAEARLAGRTDVVEAVRKAVKRYVYETISKDCGYCRVAEDPVACRRACEREYSVTVEEIVRSILSIESVNSDG